MSTMVRRFRWLVAVLLASAVGVVPGCASMGGGGMKYLVSDPSFDPRQILQL